MNTAQHAPEAIALARHVGWLEAAMTVAERHNLPGCDARALGAAVKSELENEERTNFRARAARGGLRHVGNTGRV